MRIFPLPYTVCSLGPKADDFLMGISSNVTSAALNSFIDVRANIITVFYQLKLNSDHVLIAFPSMFLERLHKHLERYLLLSDCRLQSENYQVYFDLDGDFKVREGELSLPLKVGAIIFSRQKLPHQVTERAFTEFRLDHALPMQGVDFDQEMLLNVGEAYASFDKGCYLGQEIVARVHHRGRPPRKLIVTQVAHDAPDTPLTSVVSMQDGTKRGFMFVKNQATT